MTTSRRRLGQLFNYVAELVALGLELAGLRAPDAAANASADLSSLRETRVIDDALREQLAHVASLRNRMVHDYVGAFTAACTSGARAPWGFVAVDHRIGSARGLRPRISLTRPADERGWALAR